MEEFALRLKRIVDLNQVAEMKVKDQELELRVEEVEDGIAEIIR